MTDRQLLEAMFEEIKSIKSQLEENTQITKALHHRQDETDAKIDSIAMDVHKLHGEVASLKEQTVANAALKAPLENVIHRVEDLETDVKIIKKAISS